MIGIATNWSQRWDPLFDENIPNKEPKINQMAKARVLNRRSKKIQVSEKIKEVLPSQGPSIPEKANETDPTGEESKIKTIIVDMTVERPIVHHGSTVVESKKLEQQGNSQFRNTQETEKLIFSTEKSGQASQGAAQIFKDDIQSSEINVV